ncbi:TOBE domain-containing protein [Reinekea marinisedimentorum]|uniref:Molybdopterin-binding protein n=1 Tax=Reinekea marinisedimentorum TaxID=230495 RepID=A0A4R3I3M9_9GAMM|nr:TOBE domain-containing protein [Reinekea marinisedimentorum]TCS40316.1 molybdopterin-binding protein [Reinekea marinisedimentorum]
MKLSARNTIAAKVLRINEGAVNVEVVMEISPGVEIVSIITKHAFENLNLEVGAQAYAVIKSSNVMIATE